MSVSGNRQVFPTRPPWYQGKSPTIFPYLVKSVKIPQAKARESLIFGFVNTCFKIKYNNLPT
jgi:hypothetical protein